MSVSMMMMTMSHMLVAAGALIFALPATAQDAQRGKALFNQCSACHSLEPGHNEAGPHLNGLFGRKAASVGDFVYSPPLRRANFVWTPELLDKFLAEPQAPPFRGNRMPFAGMPDPQARADLIAFMKEATR
jgi:cytochrome c